jgi:methyl-accepting chemotaxis protein
VPQRRGKIGAIDPIRVSVNQDFPTIFNASTRSKGHSMNLEEAIGVHANWKVKLRGAIDRQETLDVATITKDNACDFGKWLHGAAKAEIGRLPDYPQCLKDHAAFHAEAGKVAATINARKFTEAAAMLGAGTPYERASKAVTTAIMRLRKTMA